jgi:glycine cleavage system aminomethyltransferase T
MITRSRFILQPDWAGKPVEVETSGWPVIERFEPAEKSWEAGLTDLTHRPKAALYGPALKEYGNLKPGQAIWMGQELLGVVKPGEGVLFNLLGPGDLSLPFEATDMTEAWVLFGLWGPKAVEVLQRLFPVDVVRPGVKEPFYLVTRWHALTVQLINFKRSEAGFLLATDRSHGQNLYDGLIHGGRHLGLRPVGLELWEDWINIP